MKDKKISSHHFDSIEINIFQLSFIIRYQSFS